MKSKDRLDPDKITENLATERIGRKVIVFKSTQSTNNIAAEYAQNIENDGMVIFAEQQTKGKGRNGHHWLTGDGDSLLCSIVVTKSSHNIESLSLACAVATAQAIGKAGDSQACIKWPNDIMLKGKKVAGILLEAKKFKSHTAYILGIGINCHQRADDFDTQISQIATSIDIETGAFCDRISLAKRLLTSIEAWLKTAETKPQKIAQQWKKLSMQINHRISVIFNGKKFTGNCIGLDPEKGIILQLETGGIRMFDAVHTSIAK